jgi:two-component system NarL family sensor kinase
VQEALNNVGKHAQANQVWITVNLKSRDTVVVSVRDDGAGFDPANLERAVRNGHLGLAQMRERVMGIHGKFFLQSRPGFGTEIKVELSLTGLQE